MPIFEVVATHKNPEPMGCKYTCWVEGDTEEALNEMLRTHGTDFTLSTIPEGACSSCKKLEYEFKVTLVTSPLSKEIVPFLLEQLRVTSVQVHSYG